MHCPSNRIHFCIFICFYLWLENKKADSFCQALLHKGGGHQIRYFIIQLRTGFKIYFYNSKTVNSGNYLIHYLMFRRIKYTPSRSTTFEWLVEYYPYCILPRDPPDYYIHITTLLLSFPSTPGLHSQSVSRCGPSSSPIPNWNKLRRTSCTEPVSASTRSNLLLI